MTAGRVGAGQVFRLPDLGEGLTEAEIVTWRVAVGDTVTVDQVVVEVETAKAAVEVPVPYAGTVVALHAEAGGVLAVGAPLISVGDAALSAGDAAALSAGGAAALPGDRAAAPTVGGAAAEQYRTEERAGSGNVLIGYGTGHSPASRRRRARPATAVAAPAVAAPAVAVPIAAGPGAAGLGTAAPVARPVAEAAPPRVAPAAAAAPRVVSPLVRKLARDHGVDLRTVVPAAAHGVIRRADVERMLAPAPAPAARVEGERIPLRGVRRAVADKLTRSRTEIPEATTWVDVDATALIEAKNTLAGRSIGLLALLARICVAGLRRFPELNSTVDTEAAEIVRLPHVNLGFAAQTDRGLMVPVVHGAHRMTTAGLAAELGRLAGLARDGALPPAALTGGTFTLNNYGVFGVDGGNAIINHPEAGILGIGRIVDKPWVVDGRLAVRKVTQLSLSFDHRVCDGGTAGGFLRYVADCVENPATLLADL